MAVTFATVFVVGALAAGYITGRPAAWLAAAMGVVMLAAAVLILRRAHRAFARLDQRRQALEREIGRTA
jgi:integral membrane sensor domain MASE1